VARASRPDLSFENESCPGCVASHDLSGAARPTDTATTLAREEGIGEETGELRDGRARPRVKVQRGDATGDQFVRDLAQILGHIISRFNVLKDEVRESKTVGTITQRRQGPTGHSMKSHVARKSSLVGETDHRR
jgi:hypothetical protein